MAEALIIDALRTPMGGYRGGLSRIRPDDLAAHVIGAAVERTGLDPARVDDVYMGAANQSGEDNRDVARMGALLAGLPVEVPGVTVNRLCASGLEAVNQASRALRLGEGGLYLAGGVESMSRAPWVLAEAGGRASARRADPLRHHPRLAHDQPEDGRALLDRGDGRDRRERRREATASPARSRTASPSRATSARSPPGRTGRFDDQIVPIEVPPKTRRDEPTTMTVDEGPRADTSLEKLAKLKPAFREGGTVTAGNSSTLNDGAACLVLASEEMAEELGREPMARVVSIGVAGVDPAYMGIGPMIAIPKALEQAGLELDQIDLIELNEAFASQVLACAEGLGIDEEKLNVNGGAIALGHPLGCSGARLMTSLVWELHRRGARYGIATLCVGVGQGVATVVEAL